MPAVPPVLPLAAGSGDALMAVVVLVAVLAIWWLLRGELRDEVEQKKEAEEHPGPPR